MAIEEEDEDLTQARTGPAAVPETGAGTGETPGGETGMEEDGIMRTILTKSPSGAEDPGQGATDLDLEEEIFPGQTVVIVQDRAGEIAPDLAEESVPGLEQEMLKGQQIRRKEVLQTLLFNRNCCNLHKVVEREGQEAQA